jgi:hypothetical protein
MTQLNLGCFSTKLGKESLKIGLDYFLCVGRHLPDRAFEVESFGSCSISQSAL